MKKFWNDWGFLVIILTIFGTIVTCLVVGSVKEHNIGDEEKDYCGYVIDKGYDPPSSGHKSHTDAQYWLVLQDEDCHKAIRVHLTPGAYYGANKDERICFSLSAYELKWYGNTDELKHFK